MLRFAIAMLLSTALLGTAYTFFAMEFGAIKSGVNLPPKYDDLEARFAAFEDEVICNTCRVEE